MFGRFLVIGGLGFLVDVGLTQSLILLGAGPILARPPAMAVGILVTWIGNRYFTFSVRTKRTVSELARYSAVALGTALVNFGIYYLLVINGFVPVVAITLSASIQAIMSFLGYRYAVFGKRSS